MHFPRGVSFNPIVVVAGPSDVWIGDFMTANHDTPTNEVKLPEINEETARDAPHYTKLSFNAHLPIWQQYITYSVAGQGNVWYSLGIMYVYRTSNRMKEGYWFLSNMLGNRSIIRNTEVVFCFLA